MPESTPLFWHSIGVRSFDRRRVPGTNTGRFFDPLAGRHLDGPAICRGSPVLSWEGKPIDTGSNDAKTNGFARIAVRHFAGDIAALGTRLHRRTGQIYVQVFEPADRGTEITAALAEVAVQFFEKGVDYARLTTPGILDIGPDGLGWYQRQANSSFSYDRWT